MDEDDNSEKQIKVVLAGESGVGKSNLALRFTHDTYNRTYTPTSGVEFFLKRTLLPGSRNVTLKIWDLGGSTLHGKMIDKYIFGANAVILVYDITNNSSYETLKQWHSVVIRATKQQEQTVHLHLLGNKSDLELMRVVKTVDHNEFAKKNGLCDHLASAKSGEGVTLVFQKIAADLLGIKLTRSELEQHQRVVGAEISRPFTAAAMRRSPNTSTPVSEVCSIQ